ncbi:MAG TPA: DsbA family protein [Vitreimonas sp.]|uniref:DsbA family protein n=1 Tax=Vitreimonas sp. TaxID=3069702 RepID=UPI002D603943|nr:DsbA family protein [Vitreimonas sp.]HYD88998.1 DsbA family protein [Vitreimonas sp.]
MFAIGRRFILGAAALALVGLVGCNNAGGGAGVGADDMVLGDANAPVTLIEYASSTCPHCATFHEEVFEQLKTNYIDTGRVRYVFREYPTAPAPVAVAGFQLARCGGATPEQYFTRLGELFRQQQAIFASGTMEGVRGKFIEIGAAAGLSEEQVMQCITDEEGAERIRRIVESGNRDFNITGTPTFVIDGEKVEDPSVVTYEGLSRLLDQAAAN